ncbi:MULTISPECIES: SCO family protein [Bosea]|uniref:SCO family protein n=1 Tax=Bosea TaxID=85413 RepID=UPI00214FC017|nr:MULTISPECIES: SCO family protein [Bosea]MCR4522081.1 SCO family protein [Bosea sp. 47.2.35]MDR6829441.1 protein SCO1/2 [Bosea robiniae]MDR6896324.1 protein SCO1/2 [Bosea sp. BE109]MDR7139722.1 protein SCO1/2 [Bosea sp. BE168]MDR7176556.1 protein SCO1/2 [Bosea sp. BE271]
MNRRLVLPLVVFLAGALALAAAAILTFSPGRQGSGGSGVASVGGPFTLTTQEGKPLSDTDLKGSPFLVFFGFTHCPDICPTKLFEISEALRAAGDGAKAKGLKALFITVDPERDTPDAMKSYLGSFDPRIVGLSGDRPAIDAVVKAYRAYAKKVPLKDGDYTMDHTALVYLMGKDGKFVGAFNIEQPPAQAAAEWLRHS